MTTRLEDYLKDPCGSLSLPWWKAKSLAMPEDVMVLHARAFDEAMLADFTDEPYFRLRHNLSQIPAEALPGFEIGQAAAGDIPLIARIINESYPDISVTPESLGAWQKLPVYDPALWLTVRESATGNAAACAIGEYDPEAREGILDWVQVLTAFRRKGIGKAMVYALLSRMKGKADFATVSGQKNNPAKPEALYRACGFTGDDVWHVLRPR